MSAVTDAIQALPWDNEQGEVTGPILRDLLLVIAQGAATAIVTDAYRYGKAINADPVLSAAGGVDAMIAFITKNNSPGSNAVRAATTNIPVTVGGDFETLAFGPWLATLASPPPPPMATIRAVAIALPV